MPEPMDSIATLAPLPFGPRALGPNARLSIREPRAYVRLQLSRRGIARAGEIRLGDSTLPPVGRCAGDDPLVLGLAPDGWLLISSDVDGAALCEAARHAARDVVAAAVDVSHALVTLELTGASVRSLLARGTGLDLAPDAFATGQCTRTRLAQLPVVLRPAGVDCIELIVDGAAAGWLCDWLADAALGLPA
jgi:heterotetrameric sarcosine oxidase gamma subunit